MARLFLSLFLSTLALPAPGAEHWVEARDAHFEVYSEAGEVSALNTLGWLESVRGFFEQKGLFGASFSDSGRTPLRVVGFGSETEYNQFRLRPFADAYYATVGESEFIVLMAYQPKYLATAAHEYAHHVLRSAGLRLPACLNEGLAEFFSTLRLDEGGYKIGGDLPGRTQTLRNEKLLPLTDLLSASEPLPFNGTRKAAEVFYAESWAFVQMLLTSPHYSGHFRTLIFDLDSGTVPEKAFMRAYGESLEQGLLELEQWVQRTHDSRYVVHGNITSAPPELRTVPEGEIDSLSAEILVSIGHLEKTRTVYVRRLQENPRDANARSALGTIAFRQGNRTEALEQWRQALSDGVTDAKLCYSYALLADESGVSIAEVKETLQRAIELEPGFDDARYKLALLENNSGNYQLSIDQLKAMKVPNGARAFTYWTTLASALTELDQRDQAMAAAHEALKWAHTDSEKLRARQLAFIAATDLTVQFETDAEGHRRMVTTRVQHGTTDWNPFIESSDRIQHTAGVLTEVLCSAGKLDGFVIRGANGPVTVGVPDPLHVLIRNGPKDFYCGRVAGWNVKADYAMTDGSGRTRNILRGMTFDSSAELQ